MIFWDSSALVALLVEEPDSKARAKQLAADPIMAVWWGSPVECESAIQRRLRERALTQQQVRIAQQRLAQLISAWHEVAPMPGVRTLALRLLRTHSLRAADALQLAAALTLAGTGLTGLQFLSADIRLNQAAEIENLTVIHS